MADEVDDTLRQSEVTIAKMDAMLKQADELLESGRKLMDDNNVTPEALHSFIGQQNEAGKAEFAKEVQAIHEEIERDLPKQEVLARQTRVRPTRQMV